MHLILSQNVIFLNALVTNELFFFFLLLKALTELSPILGSFPDGIRKILLLVLFLLQ